VTRDLEERGRGERLLADERGAVVEQREGHIKVVEACVPQLDGYDVTAQERVQRGRRAPRRPEAVAEKCTASAREDDDIAAFERRVGGCCDADAELAHGPCSLALLLPALLVLREREQGIESACGTLDDDGVVLHENRIERAMDERYAHDARASLFESAYEPVVLRDGKPRLDGSDAHVRIDRPRHLECARVVTTHARDRAARAAHEKSHHVVACNGRAVRKRDPRDAWRRGRGGPSTARESRTWRAAPTRDTCLRAWSRLDSPRAASGRGAHLAASSCR